jgi:hypothetical protein
MHVVHTAGVPPNQGSSTLPISSCSMNNRNAERKVTVAGSMARTLDHTGFMPDGLLQMSGNSGKSASIIQVLAAVLVVGSVWLHFSERDQQLEKHIALLEADAKALAPLSKVMRGFQPNRATPHAYEALQATGPANAPEPGADSALAWCPAAEDGGME